MYLYVERRIVRKKVSSKRHLHTARRVAHSVAGQVSAQPAAARAAPNRLPNPRSRPAHPQPHRRAGGQRRRDQERQSRALRTAAWRMSAAVHSGTAPTAGCSVWRERAGAGTGRGAPHARGSPAAQSCHERCRYTCNSPGMIAERYDYLWLA